MKDELNLSANTPLNLSKSTQKCRSDFLQGTLAIYETIAIDTGSVLGPLHYGLFWTNFDPVSCASSQQPIKEAKAIP